MTTETKKITKANVVATVRSVRAALRQVERLTERAASYDDFWFATSAARRARNLAEELETLVNCRREDERQRIIAETGVDP